MAEKPTYEELEKRIQELEKAELKRKQTELELQRRLAFEQLVKEISSELAASGGGSSIDSAIDRALSSVGTFTGADRAYIFRFRNGEAKADNTHEWCAEGIEPQIDHLKGILIDEELPWFSKIIRNHEVFHVPNVRALPNDAKLEQKHFEEQSIQSLIVVPMKTKTRLIGFLGFDAVSEPRNWGQEDRTILQFFAQTLCHVIERDRAEKALLDSEKKYHHILDNASTVIFIKDTDGKYVYINRLFEKLHGIKNEAIYGLTDHDVFPPDLANRFRMNDLTVLQSGKALSLEEVAPYQDGLHTVLSTKFPLFDMEEKIYAICGISTDITDRKHMEEALRENEAFLQTLMDAIPTPVFYKDRNGKYLGFNKAFETFFGKERDLIIGKSVFEINPPELAEIYRAKDEELFKTGGKQRYESQWKNAHGELRDFIFNKAVFKDSKGAVSGLIGVLTDITERKRMEAALLESEEKFRLISEQALMAIVIVQDNGIKYANQAYLNLTGYTWEELRDWTVDDTAKLIHPDDLSFVMEQGRKKAAGIKNGIVTHYSYRGINKSGKVIWVDQYSKTISYKGKPANLMTLIDINTRKKLETQLHRAQKLEAMGLLAGGVAHDLNNILSGIISYPELLLLDLPEDSPLRKPIKTIQESGMRAADVVADLLTIARGVATGKEILNLNAIITEYLGSPEQRKLEETHGFVDLRTQLTPDLLNINGSLIHVKNALMNLVANASEAIEGSGTVTISTHNRYLDEPLNGYEAVRQGEYAVLSVSDEGGGIATEDLERIFEPFYTKKVMGRSGTGLGLAVVWNTVQDHKGYINVRNRKNGTTFELYFPVAREKLTTLKYQAPLEEYLGHGEKILVVDDEERQREIACGMLVRLGYDANAVGSGEEGVEFIKENPQDLIVLDMIMPNGMNGLETYKAIAKLRPGQKVIIASGYAKTQDVETAQTLGAGEYVKKPYTLQKLGLAIKEELQKIA